MIRLLYSVSILAWIGTAWVLVETFCPGPADDLEQACALPSVAEQVARTGSLRAGGFESSLSPLVAQAQAFAAGVNPSQSVRQSDGPTVRPSGRPPMRPAGPSVGVAFKVQAISLYPGQPDRSMALIVESGSAEETGRWVKKDSQIGPWVVQEVRRGMVVVRNRDGQQVREVSLERSPSQRTLVRQVWSGSKQVSSSGYSVTPEEPTSGTYRDGEE